MESDFKFYLPVDLEKSTSSNKKEERRYIIKGMAGATNKDSDGEYMDMNKFDMSRMYYMNWEHGKKASDVVGVILKKSLKSNGDLFIEGELFNDYPEAVEIYNLGERLAKHGKKLGLSIEGKITERDPQNENIVRKAELYGVAICKVPVNGKTYVDLVKSFSGKEEYEEPEEEEEDLLEEEEEEQEKVEKMSTADIAPLMPESVEGDPKRTLKKSEAYQYIFKNVTNDSVLADEFYLLTKSIKMEVTKETLEKARQILGLAAEEKPNLEKGQQADMNVAGEENGGKIEELRKSMHEAKKAYDLAKGEYNEMCKAAGIKPEGEPEEELEKGVNMDLFKSEIFTPLTEKMEELIKSVDIKTKALGTLLSSDREESDGRFVEIQEQLEKANSTIENLQEFNNALNGRLKIVEKTPLRKSVTNLDYKERFPANHNSDKKVYNIDDKADRSAFLQDVQENFGDLTKSENAAILTAASEYEVAGRFSDKGLQVLRKVGYDFTKG